MYKLYPNDTVLGLSNGLTTKSTCTCLGYNVMFECTVFGGYGVTTVWKGTAFNCSNGLNEISLIHSRFPTEEGAHGSCNNGKIKGQSLWIENNYYISQLNVLVSFEMLGETIECIHDDGIKEDLIGRITITSTTGLLSLLH